MEAIYEPSLSVEYLTISYNGEPILEDLYFGYSGNGMIQVIGPNGAGKSTLLRSIAGLMKPKKGIVRINGTDITAKPFLASRFLSFVPQLTIADRSITFPITAGELLLFELRVSGEKLSKKSSREKIISVAEIVGLSSEELEMDLRAMSGGQKQKVFIARALIHDRPMLLLDEPLSSIDPASRAEIAEKISELSEKKLVVVTSHDPMAFMESTARILLVNRKTYFFGTPEEVLKEGVLEKIYGRMIVKNGRHVHFFDDSCVHNMKK